MKIRTLIVDDEEIAREVLAGYCSKYCPVIEIIGQARDIRDAVPMIKAMQPQLIFLDVEMPFGNAFDILEACHDLQFETIFVTAFSEYSMKALNQSAAYYILKPIDILELVSAVNRVQLRLLQTDEFNRNKLLLDNLRLKPEKQKVMLPTLQGFDVISTEHIVRLQANGNFTDVHFHDGRLKMVCKFLKYFDEILDARFVRIHRSSIININFVRSFSRATGGTVSLTDGTELEVSATYKDYFIKALEL